MNSMLEFEKLEKGKSALKTKQGVKVLFLYFFISFLNYY
jgi:hypothetical protein